MNSSTASPLFSQHQKRRSLFQLNELAMFTKSSTPTNSVIPQKRVKTPKMTKILSRTEILHNYLSIRSKLQFQPKRQSIPKLKPKLSIQEIPPQITIEQMISEPETKSIKSTSRHSMRIPISRISNEYEYQLFEPEKPINFRCLVQEVTNKKVKIDYSAVIRQMVEKISLLKRLNIKFTGSLVFNSKPFQKPHSYDFITACKLGDLMRVKELLKFDRFLVFSFDYIHQTGLHWAVKRNHQPIVKYLLQIGCDPDAIDLIGRPAMHFAVESRNYEVLKLLLENQASPWSTQKITYSKLCGENHRIMFLLNKARKFHVIFKMVDVKQRVFLKQKLLKGAFEC